jgi:hypothetical protein
MRIGISLILFLILHFIPGIGQENPEDNSKESDKINLEDRLGIIIPNEELHKNDSKSLLILPFPDLLDSSHNQDNMPVFKLYSADPMPNADIAQPGVTYFILNSMGSDHYMKPINPKKNKIQPPNGKSKK